MIVKGKYCDYYLAIISSRRPQNVLSLEENIGHEATWFVRDEQDLFDYFDDGAVSVVMSGGLCESRNAALEAAWELDLPCVQLSDDLKEIKYVTPDPTSKLGKGGGKRADLVSFDFAISEIFRLWTFFSRFRMAGISPVPNLFYHNNPITTSSFCVGDFIIVKKCPLYFDEELTLKEDYDYTAQHLQMYDGVFRYDNIMPVFLHKTNLGGAVDIRTEEEEQKNIAYLQEKWGSEQMAHNKTRPNEILMRIRGVPKWDKKLDPYAGAPKYVAGNAERESKIEETNIG